MTSANALMLFSPATSPAANFMVSIGVSFSLWGSRVKMADVLAADQKDPLGSMIRNEDLRQVKHLLRREPDDVREMFALRFGQGLRVREVAAVMNLGEAAVKQRFARTLRKIRQELLAEEPERKGGPECMIAD